MCLGPSRLSPPPTLSAQPDLAPKGSAPTGFQVVSLCVPSPWSPPPSLSLLSPSLLCLSHSFRFPGNPLSAAASLLSPPLAPSSLPPEDSPSPPLSPGGFCGDLPALHHHRGPAQQSSPLAGSGPSGWCLVLGRAAPVGRLHSGPTLANCPRLLRSPVAGTAFLPGKKGHAWRGGLVRLPCPRQSQAGASHLGRPVQGKTQPRPGHQGRGGEGRAVPGPPSRACPITEF